MEKPTRLKAKTKPAASKSKPKKRKSDGPTCSMFLAELTRKLALRKKIEEESPVNVVESIIDSIARALPVKLTRTAPVKETPPTIESLQTYAPELISKDVDVIKTESGIKDNDIKFPSVKPAYKVPKLPTVPSEVLNRQPFEIVKINVMKDASVNTSTKHDVAGEITKHVGTLKKISLIAEEFNQKTAKNLKEIVDSVQEDLMKKLEEIKAEESLAYDLISDIV